MSKNAAKGSVVLLHGIARTSLTMRKMERHFTLAGYRVLNIHYPSCRFPIEQLAEGIHDAVEKFNTEDGALHFVGYSTGGLVTRTYISKHRPHNLGRVVLMATPNGGSEVADFLKAKANGFYKWYFGPAGQQLVTKPPYAATLPPVDYETGVVAGDWSIDPISTFLLIKGKNDGKVSVERAKTYGMKDHIVLHATHTFMMENAKAILQARHFIENGYFER